METRLLDNATSPTQQQAFIWGAAGGGGMAPTEIFSEIVW